MSRIIYCVKLKKEAEALEKRPFPGDLGEKIFQEISKEAWQLWLKQQTMLINEHRLNMAAPKDRDLLKTKMQEFLFA